MPFATPDPALARCLDDLAEQLRLLKVWAGDPSYETIKDRVNAAWTAAGRPAGELTRKTTVADCFRSGRRRLNAELVIAIVEVLHPDAGYVAQWRQTLRVVGGEQRAAAQVRVQDKLPQDLTGFTGRAVELDRLRHAGQAVVISAIEGMAGVGKTQLAVHAGHRLLRDNAYDRVLFVNLRGFHPDPAQPPADPAAVLDGFLRLLGVPGHEIPHDLAARTAAYRDRLAGTRTLIVLDNAATTEQVRPLLPGVPGCLTLVTSRRGLAGLAPATRLAVGVFTPDEAMTFLARAVPDVPAGPDPGAAARIARRCGYLPLALGLIAGRIRGTPGWTLTDHAERLDECHQDGRLDTGVELALAVSYQHLSPAQRQLLRSLALHPGQDFDAHAATAVAAADLPDARARLGDLCRDHLLQQVTPGRYTFHDLVRVYATDRAHDEDRPQERRAALTRLFDYYLAATATAMDTLHPAEAAARPRIPPAGTPVPSLAEPESALDWLDTERPALVAVAAHTAAHGWPTHTTRLARTLFRYLSSGHLADALTVHGHAERAARDSGDLAGQAHAATDIGYAHVWLGRHEPAAGHFRRALELFRRVGDRTGEARALHSLGTAMDRLGRFTEATDHQLQALALYRAGGDRTGEARTLHSLGINMERLGRFAEAADYCRLALDLFRQLGNRAGEANALNGLGEVEVSSGRYGPAEEHLQEALALHRRLGNRVGEASVLDSLGTLYTRIGRLAEATGHHEQALAICREIGDQDGVAWAMNGLGEVAQLAGRPAEALGHYTDALAVAADIGVRDQLARAHLGLGHACHALGAPDPARDHYRQALALHLDLAMPGADEIRARITTLDRSTAGSPSA